MWLMVGRRHEAEGRASERERQEQLSSFIISYCWDYALKQLPVFSLFLLLLLLFLLLLSWAAAAAAAAAVTPVKKLPFSFCWNSFWVHRESIY